MGKPLKDLGIYRGDIMVTLRRSILDLVDLSTYSLALPCHGLCAGRRSQTRGMTG